MEPAPLLHQIPQNTPRKFAGERGGRALGGAFDHFLAGSGAGSGFLARNFGGNGIGGRCGGNACYGRKDAP